ncbi:MAG: rRNA maturation RNase YbeY [Chloroflexi bacterium]|nr:rRNA maturation RNase YbeY [Chloroflexota bacterium]
MKIRASFRKAVARKDLARAAQGALQGQASPVELEVAVVGDREMRRLNLAHRGQDETTDVLAFALREGPADFVAPPDGVLHLGQVVVSYHQAERQAREAGQAVAEEIRLLVVHGVLHLLGYDHEDSAAEAAMRARERAVLSELAEVNPHD